MPVKKIKTLMKIAIILLVITACNNKKVDPITEESAEKLAIPTPSADAGVVHGKILSMETGRPPESNIYLSKDITADDPEVPAMLSFSYQTNPRAQIDEEGNFIFIDIPPGVYAITLWTPPNNAYFIPAEDGQDYLWVVVEAGKSLDMGEIQVP